MAQFRAALKIAERLAALDPDNVQWQLDLASVNLRLAIMGDDPLRRLHVAADILRKLKAAGKLTPQQEALLDMVEAMIAKAEGQGRG
jgi:hypothetical protein